MEGELKGELKNVLEVWSLAIACLCYAYFLASKIPRGFLRLLSLLPVISLFLLLPMKLSSYFFCGTTSMFLSWYANFKLILFSFDQGPLFPLPPNFLHFFSISSLPIKIKQFISKKTKQDEIFNPLSRTTSLALKALLLHMIFQAYKNRDYLNITFVFILFPIKSMFEAEWKYALYQIPAKILLGPNHELEPQFVEPLLSTTLQDFWGKRWNLMSSDVLRDTVYNPSHRLSTRLIGPRWASLPAVLATFTMSGLLHELVNYHLLRCFPTWEATCFFIIHGICVDIEIVLKKKNVRIMGDSLVLNLLSRVFVLGFLLGTSFGLLYAPWMRYGMYEKTFLEYSIVVDFLKGLVRSMKSSLMF